MKHTVSLVNPTICIDGRNAVHCTAAAAVFFRRSITPFMFSCRPTAPSDIHGPVYSADAILSNTQSPTNKHAIPFTFPQLLNLAKRFCGNDDAAFSAIERFINHIYA